MFDRILDILKRMKNVMEHAIRLNNVLFGITKSAKNAEIFKINLKSI